LPCPLPSEEEITRGTVLCGDTSNHCLVTIGEHFIIKYGSEVSEVEGQNMLFIEQYADAYLVTPKLYAMWRMSSTGYICLAMQRLAGESLEILWPQLTEEEKSAVCAKLKNAFDSLRKLPSPSFYGGIGRTPLPHHFFWDSAKTPEINGPFGSEAELNAGILRKLRHQSKQNRGYLDFKIEFYERHLNDLLKKHGSVFSHSDLQRKNILVSRHAGAIMSVVIVDWEDEGWYPGYWEYCLQIASTAWADDWTSRLEDIIAPWPHEASIFRMLYQDLYF
jgi:hypothetical protein